jgi:hypothetical protein
MAKAPRRIDLSLFDDELKTIINAAAKIFPVEYSYVLANTNPNNYEYVKILSGDHKREIYLWLDNSWGLIGADEQHIDWTEVENPPSTFPPSSHKHPESDLLSLDKYTKGETDTLLGTKSDKTHGHADLHAHANKALLDNLSQGNLDLWNTVSSKSDVGHDHDGRYFTEAEVTVLLNGKSDKNHNHDTSYAAKSIEATVADHTTRLGAAESNIAENTTDINSILTAITNGDNHSNIAVLEKLAYTGALGTIDLKAIETNASAITTKANTVHTHTKSQITDFPSLATVATSGSYNDLSNKPAIPDISGKADKSYVDTQDSGKVDTSTFNGHTGNTTVHVTQTDKDNWNNKWATAKKITLTGDVTGSVNVDGLNDVSFTATAASVDPAKIRNGYFGTNRIYANTHPENGGMIIPFINNDLAFLTSKGGAMTSYKTSDTDFTKLALTNTGAVAIDTAIPFDGTPSYANCVVSAVTDVVIIDINCPWYFNYTTNFYIDFGSTNWRAKDVKFYAFSSDPTNSEQFYKLMGTKSNSYEGEFTCANSYTYLDNVGATKQGFDRLRIVLTNFNVTSARIACIGLIGYNSSGLKETYLSRGGGAMYGSITPQTHNAISLGTNSKFWASVYATTYYGYLSGIALNAYTMSQAAHPGQDQLRHPDSAVAGIFRGGGTHPPRDRGTGTRSRTTCRSRRGSQAVRAADPATDRIDC